MHFFEKNLKLTFQVAADHPFPLIDGIQGVEPGIQGVEPGIQRAEPGIQGVEPGIQRVGSIIH